MVLSDKNSSQKIGLALGGGAALGAAHIGVLRAFEEADIQIDYLAGTSIGAMVGAFYAFGMKLDKIEEIALNLDWPDVSSITLSKMGLLTNKELGKLLDRHLGSVTFEEAKIPLAVIATDISEGKKLILKEGNVSDAVKASTCIPVLFEPVKINELLVVDGGLVENVPISALKSFGAGYTIGVDLKAYRKYKRPKNILDILNNTLDIALSHLANVNPNDIDLLIQPNLKEFSRTDIEHAEKMIQRGYDAATRSLNASTKK